MVAMQSEGAIQMADLPSALVNHATLSEVKHFADLVNSEPDTEFRRDVGLTAPPIRELERRAIMKALADTGGQRAKAASMLGIGRTTLYRKMKEYDIG
jgi:transcriptional regulator of acetoin/glycerol metabolism